MSSVGTFKSLSLFFCLVLVGACTAQKTNSTPGASAAGTASDVRPAIIQRGSEPAHIVATPGVSGVQLSSASFHLASDEEVLGMEQTLEQYVIAFESMELSQIQKVWPDLDRQHAKSFKSAFAAFKSSSANPRLGLQCATPRVTDDAASVQCTETVTYSVGKGKTKEVGPAKVSIQLKGQSAHWVLQDMKGIG